MRPTNSESQVATKGAALLAFLRENATIRRQRVTKYGAGDRILWFKDVPREAAECRSPFLSHRPDDLGELWLEVRKPPMPTRPPEPAEVKDWVRADALNQAEKAPELRPEITVIVKRQVPDPDAPQGSKRMIVEEVPEIRRLEDHPEVEEVWLQYLIEKWEPWAEKMRRWQKVQDVYETVDFMRRRLEEAEERYELVLAIGLLQWRDPTGTDIKRHVLTAPAEFAFDASRGVLTVVPAASFEGFRVELDMLDFKHRPRLDEDELERLLEELDVQAWDTALVAPILREIANRLRSDALVDDVFQPADRIEERPRISFAPALVLRERNPTAYDDLVCKLHEAAQSGELKPTEPWARLLREGEPANPGQNALSFVPQDPRVSVESLERILFPKPANEEQRQIVQRLETDPCVLVKGPPGTGKSHTIANLICHLLSRGERVLVTAHASQALDVLRGLLPKDIRDLCVTALGSSSSDQRLLEESVREILRRKNEWRGPSAAQQAIEEVEKQLRKLEDELARVERDLRTFREAETYRHELPGGYAGTLAQIARMVSQQKEEYSWFPELPADTEFPLDPSESEFLVDAQARFTAEARAELELDLGDVELPSPDAFRELVERARSAEEKSQRLSRGVDSSKAHLLEGFGVQQLRNAREAVQKLADVADRAERVLGEITEAVLGDLLASTHAKWVRLLRNLAGLVTHANQYREALRAVRVKLSDNVTENQLKKDVERRLAHLEGRGRKGFWIFAPRVIRDTRYVVNACLVDGAKAKGVEELRRVRDWLELRSKLRELEEVSNSLLPGMSNPTRALSRAKELVVKLRELLEFFASEEADSLARVLGSKRTELVSAVGRSDWIKAIDGILAYREARDLQKEFDRLLDVVRGLRLGSKAHPCLSALEDAARRRDVAMWRTAWEKREQLRQDKQRLSRYDALLVRLDESCPGLREILCNSAGEPVWQDRVRKLRDAWNWAAACAWLRRVSNPSDYEARVQDYHRLQDKIQRVTQELASLRAWKAFFDRLDQKTIQSLKAWTKAMNRIGKGTGKYAYRHRRTARKYLMECVPRIPAWIMPFHKLWDSVEPQPGLFDTVIVDEASQAGVEALLLLLLAKRIVVVGDDKQNSPEAVGILEDDIARLAHEHLREFRFRDEFRPDTSLFDHAERTFGPHITLREHFRCVPEIIRFSNDLCYRDTPLIPLRQPPPKRLPPLLSRFVAEGRCEEGGSKIQNRAEAEAIVETIVKLVDDPAYEGKSMGVIALQGHAQAQLIEKLLAERLLPKVIEERRLRCGEPATFQGDERDVIFLSLVIAPNVHPRALTRLPDERRFNVAMSRARDQVWLFYSAKPSDLSEEDLRFRLIQFFENPQVVDFAFEELDRLEREAKRPRRLGTQPEPYESWFEVDVALKLLRRKFRIRPQVEVAGYRIDLVVEGLDKRLAVECDGDAWHGPEQYERDMVRQRQLERAGWKFVRVRESDFYIDKERVVTEIVEACKELGIRPVDFAPGTQHEPTKTPPQDAGRPDRVSAAIASDDSEGILPEEGNSSSIVGPFTGYSKT